MESGYKANILMGLFKKPGITIKWTTISALPGNNTELKYLTLFVISIEPLYLPNSNPLSQS